MLMRPMMIALLALMMIIWMVMVLLMMIVVLHRTRTNCTFASAHPPSRTNR